MTMKHSPATTADTPAQRMSFELVIFTFFSFYLLDHFVYRAMKILAIEANRGTSPCRVMCRLTCLAQYPVFSARTTGR
jgi:hypothetical protein